MQEVRLEDPLVIVICSCLSSKDLVRDLGKRCLYAQNI